MNSPASTEKRPREIIAARACRCSDCKNHIPAHNPGYEVNRRRVCPNCVGNYRWSTMLGQWVINVSN